MASPHETTNRTIMRSWINKLHRFNFKSKESNSQFGEAEIIAYIFKHIAPTNKYFVDIGAGFYGHGIMSNTNDLLQTGWQGIKIDAENKDDLTIHKLYVTPENIVPFMQEHSVPYGFDLLCIDIDSFDLDILEAVVPEYKPRVICTEYNGTLDTSISIKLKYEEGYIWDETNKYGYSFGAAVKFCNKYGYKIIFNHVNQNLFIVRSDVVSSAPNVSARQVWYHPFNPNAIWEQYE